MQKRKLFIEIEVPRQVLNRIRRKVEHYKNLPLKWTKDENIHITVLFLGYVDETVIGDICTRVREVCDKIEAFDINFKKIELGPDPEDPQMLWVRGEQSEELLNLHKSLSEALEIYSPDRKTFVPHITLGRMRMYKWDELAEKPIVDENINLSIPVLKVQVMESNLQKGGAHYTPLESCPLQ